VWTTGPHSADDSNRRAPSRRARGPGSNRASSGMSDILSFVDSLWESNPSKSAKQKPADGGAVLDVRPNSVASACAHRPSRCVPAPVHRACSQSGFARVRAFGLG
jgi:hypothetical protein